jgi:diaminohydroxyphosphoribosylaminopyrimidine deaminase/5-amino-6-(5-phosphoribosylamino)uracil reductase
VLVEGGAELFGSLVRAGLADELWLFVAPKLLGGDGRSWLGALGVERMADAVPLREVTYETSGEDLLLRARFEKEAGR